MKSLTKSITPKLNFSLAFSACLFLVIGLGKPASSLAASDGAVTTLTVIAQDTSDVYTVVDEMPEIEGGLPALYKKIKYPEEARKKDISGRVYLQVIVDENGNAKDPVILKGIGGGCGDAAADAITEVKFKPGKKDGKAVKVKYSLPITFRIEK